MLFDVVVFEKYCIVFDDVLKKGNFFIVYDMYNVSVKCRVECYEYVFFLLDKGLFDFE